MRINLLAIANALTALLVFTPFCDAQTPRTTQTPIKTKILGLTLGAISSEENIKNSVKRETGFSLRIMSQRQGLGIAYAFYPYQSDSSKDKFFYAGCIWDYAIVRLDKDNRIYQIGFELASATAEPARNRYKEMKTLFIQKYGRGFKETDTASRWSDGTSMIYLGYNKQTSMENKDLYYCQLYYYDVQLFNASEASNAPDI